MRAMLSGSMSGSFAYVLKRKFHLVGPESEEKQDTDDYTCQGPSNGIFGQWSHDFKSVQFFIYFAFFLMKTTANNMISTHLES
jgi:hypothetical protein